MALGMACCQAARLHLTHTLSSTTSTWLSGSLLRLSVLLLAPLLPFARASPLHCTSCCHPSCDEPCCARGDEHEGCRDAATSQAAEGRPLQVHAPRAEGMLAMARSPSSRDITGIAMMGSARWFRSLCQKNCSSGRPHLVSICGTGASNSLSPIDTDDRGCKANMNNANSCK